ncbi:hypothetical protein [Neorhodopirellula lusitana]|uniref:hypothetical protein n=1 Tax=Neorhodopirellula lusitana TaxID=445327 RepID=UPI00384A573C
MIEHTSTIEATFQIEGRGCVLVPGIPRDADTHVKIGDHVYILDEHRDCIDTVIRGIELIRAQPRLKGFPILLPKSITKDDIAIGAELHIVEQSPSDGKQNKSHFDVGDNVNVLMNARNHSPHVGQITEKLWHHKFQLWYYYLRDSDGHKVSKRYTAADLLPAEKRTEP